ncbi:uncharacterized protein BJ212DRAFT_1299148 [Suillus subaureus]|uniref:Uncharacterized protein n=1 Tax=Suillus subaureus TaxID=48587 RepID=A0A9P7JEI0_9AGAM|nr:uncharacterized protein BJ212DRAFT_1299148 [Suillus subaureus]KAG1817614.1 hypothetical protein BJ212DRAFT_1299148 [Suillus subaureus]
MQLSLDPPTPLFTVDNSSSAPPSLHAESTKDLSLSVNYLPNKFSSGLLTPTPRRCKLGKENADHPIIHKRGGGREAFKSSEAHMPAEGDEDYDSITGRWFSGKEDIVHVGNQEELILSTAAVALTSVTFVISWAGILLNNCSSLAVYTFALWLCFALLITPSYTTYKQHTFNLEGKLNAQWSHDLSAEGHFRIQNRLHCCGYYSPFIEATVSYSCYTCSILPGCKEAYINFEKCVLDIWYTIAFSLVLLPLA